MGVHPWSVGPFGFPHSLRFSTLGVCSRLSGVRGSVLPGRYLPSWALVSSPFCSWVSYQSCTASVAPIEAVRTASPPPFVFYLRWGRIRRRRVAFRSNAFPIAILRQSALSSRLRLRTLLHSHSVLFPVACVVLLFVGGV